MIINLDPIEVVFDKVVTDLNITEHDVDVNAFTQWAMEAMEHIGGMNRIEQLNKLLPEAVTIGSPLIDHKITFPDGVLDIAEVRYYKDGTVHRDDFTLCYPALGAYMDDAADTILFDRVYTIGIGGRERSTMALVFNRKDGIVQCLGCKLPFYTLGAPATNRPQLFVPAIASYQEAVYWYICSKMLWRDVFRGRNKGNQLQHANGMFNNMKNLAYGDLMMPDHYEIQGLADELSLGVSYTGLNKRMASYGRDNKIPTKFYWKYKKSDIKPLT